MLPAGVWGCSGTDIPFWGLGRCTQGQPVCVTCAGLALSALTVPPHALQVFHYLSIAILTFFMMEIAFKIFVFRLEFFHHKFEILDSIVVVVSFVLDIVLVFQEHEFEALGLLILLRLWRVARIINGMSPALLGAEPGGGVESACRGRQSGFHAGSLLPPRSRGKWSHLLPVPPPPRWL